MKKNNTKKPKQQKEQQHKEVENLGTIVYTKENPYAAFPLGVDHIRLHIA